jgi:hypothetical protein
MLPLLISSAFLLGMAAGPRFCIPALVGVMTVGLPSLTGLRGWAVGLMVPVVTSVILGVVLCAFWRTAIGGSPPVTSISWERTQVLWTECLTVFQDFPVIGAGLGSFGAIHPYVKTHNASSTTAMSSLLQWTAETGTVGLLLLVVAIFWTCYRLPGVVKRVGSADRTLAYGLVGAAVGFSLWSLAYWTVELPAVAISASALGGTWNRWLAGGTDLFVDRG